MARPSKESEVDWVKIKRTFIVSPDEFNITHLAKLYKVSRPNVSLRCKKEDWRQQRLDYQKNITQHAVDKEEIEKNITEIIYSQIQAIQDDKKIAQNLKAQLVFAIKDFKGDDDKKLMQLIRAFNDILTAEERLYGTLVKPDPVKKGKDVYISEWSE